MMISSLYNLPSQNRVAGTGAAKSVIRRIASHQSWSAMLSSCAGKKQTFPKALFSEQTPQRLLNPWRWKSTFSPTPWVILVHDSCLWCDDGGARITWSHTNVLNVPVNRCYSMCTNSHFMKIIQFALQHQVISKIDDNLSRILRNTYLANMLDISETECF